MPYLHWETHKRRKQMADVTKKISSQHRKDSPQRKELLREGFTRIAQEVNLARAVTDLHQRKTTSPTGKNIAKKEPGPLGKYLLQIAKIYDAMDIEPDVRMLRDHLHQEPPLHSRRTLDQSYYWKLQNTDNRDEDQVVFRATQEGKSIFRSTRVVMVDQLWLYILDESKQSLEPIHRPISNIIPRHNYFQLSTSMGAQQARLLRCAQGYPCYS